MQLDSEKKSHSYICKDILQTSKDTIKYYLQVIQLLGNLGEIK